MSRGVKNLKKKIRYILMLLLVVFAYVSPSAVAIAKVTQDTLGYTILAKSQGELITVKDYNIIDGDTADLILDRQDDSSIKARFLLIDAPELNDTYGDESKQKVIDLFKEADLIQIEYEGKTKDKYDRDLVHVWLDGILLQEILVTEGYAIARYIDGYISNSKYEQSIYDSQDYAKRNGLVVWKDGNSSYTSKAEYPVNSVVAPAVETTPAAAEQPTQSQNVYYQNCDAVRAAGAAPIYPGDPGWQQKFDRDKDGIGCE